MPPFGEMVERAPDAVILVDAGGSIAYANRCALQLFGVEFASLCGQGIDSLIPGFNQAQGTPHAQVSGIPQTFHRIGSGRVTLTGRRVNGRELPLDIRFSPLERGGQPWTLAILRDATEPHLALEQARAAREAAEEMARQKGEFLGFAAHDLSQPVQTLELMLDTIGLRAPQPSEIAELAALATISLARMRELLKMLLKIARIESGTLQVHPEPVEVAEIYDYLGRQFGPMARAKALTFVIEPSTGIIEADPALLRGLLSNIVANAIRYTPRGEVRLRAPMSAQGTLRLEVRDTGIGIPSEHLQTIFEDFRRLEAAQQAAGEGFGLGLGIVRRLSHLLGFPVTVESKLGRGSSFAIEIPSAKIFRTAA